jgi:hypothetical protein
MRKWRNASLNTMESPSRGGKPQATSDALRADLREGRRDPSRCRRREAMFLQETEALARSTCTARAQQAQGLDVVPLRVAAMLEPRPSTAAAGFYRGHRGGLGHRFTVAYAPWSNGKSAPRLARCVPVRGSRCTSSRRCRIEDDRERRRVRQLKKTDSVLPCCIRAQYLS